MSYIYDPEMLEIMGCKCDAAIARDSKGRRLTTPHRQTGLWLNVAVPHNGWTCVRVHRHVVNDHDDCVCPQCIQCETLGFAKPVFWIDASRTCEMCEVAEIKWVHTMFHPDYPAKLACGKVCAGILQQNMEAAQQFEKYAKAVERARKRHAEGMKAFGEAIDGARSSDWDTDASRDGGVSWFDDDHWRSLCGRIMPRSDKTYRSFMVLEGIGDYWLSVNRRGLNGYGANAGRMHKGWRQPGSIIKRTYTSVQEAQGAAITMMAGWWKSRLDKNLASALDRNKAVNEFGDVVELE